MQCANSPTVIFIDDSQFVDVPLDDERPSQNVRPAHITIDMGCQTDELPKEKNWYENFNSIAMICIIILLILVCLSCFTLVGINIYQVKKAVVVEDRPSYGQGEGRGEGLMERQVTALSPDEQPMIKKEDTLSPTEGQVTAPVTRKTIKKKRKRVSTTIATIPADVSTLLPDEPTTVATIQTIDVSTVPPVEPTTIATIPADVSTVPPVEPTTTITPTVNPKLIERKKLWDDPVRKIFGLPPLSDHDFLKAFTNRQ